MWTGVQPSTGRWVPLATIQGQHETTAAVQHLSQCAQHPGCVVHKCQPPLSTSFANLHLPAPLQMHASDNSHANASGQSGMFVLPPWHEAAACLVHQDAQRRSDSPLLWCGLPQVVAIVGQLIGNAK